MSVTADQIAQAAQNLAAVAGVFSPQSAPALALLISTVATLNTLVQQIRTQTDADAQRVWQKVQTDFNLAVAAFNASQGPTAHA